MKRAVNPETGEVVFLVNNQWVSPSSTALNDAGEKAYLVNNKWVLPPVAPPEPILTPEEQMTAPPEGPEGTKASDYGKLFGAGAVKGTLGAPEAVMAGSMGISRDTVTKPTEILNYLADPRKLANDFAQAISLPKLFEDKTELSVVPEKTIQKQKLAIDEVRTLGRSQSLRDLTQYGSDIANRIEDSVTPAMKQALADSQPTGNIIQAFQTGDFSDISLGKDPSLAGIFGQAAKVFGSTAPAVLTGVVFKSPLVGGVAGFGQAGSEGVDTAREHIKAMSDEELAKNSEYFRNLLVLGYKPEMARNMTEDKAADTAAYYQGLVGALGNQFTANLIKGKLDDAVILGAKTRLGRIAKGTAAGMTEEGLQELAEGVATDLGIDRTVVREMGVDSFANVVLGAIGGGAPGGFRGAVAKDKSEAPPVETPPVDEGQPPVTPAGEAEVVAPKAPVSGAIGVDELETDETPAAPVVPAQQATTVEATPEVNALQQEYDALNARLMAGEVAADEFTEVNDRLADIQSQLKQAPQQAPAAPVVQQVAEEVAVDDPALKQIELQKKFVKAEESGLLTKPQANQVFNLMQKEQTVKAEALLDKFMKSAEEKKAVEAPVSAEVAMRENKRLSDFLSKDKNETIKNVAETNNISLDYAEKAYNEEKEYLENFAKYGYAPNPDPDHESKFMAAQKKHDAFQNKLNSVRKKAKEKKETTPVAVEKTQAEINKERQAEKKAKASLNEEETIVDAIRNMAYDKKLFASRKYSADDFIAKHGKKMFDRALELDLLDNEPGSGRLFPSNNFAYKMIPKYYDQRGVKLKEPAKEEAPKVEAKPKVEEEPKVEEIPQAKVKEIQEFSKETPVSKEYQAALNKSRKATKAFQSAQDGYRKQLINDKEFIAARKRYDEAMTEYDVAYAEEADRPESVKAKPVKAKPTVAEKPVEGFDAYVDSVSDQIDRLVEYARIDLRTNITREEVINKLRETFKDSQEKAQGALDNTESNMLKAAKERLLGDLKADYREATGKPLNKEADLVRAIKSGVLDISGQENADDVYKLYDIKKSDIKKVSTEGGVPALIDKFKGSFFGKPTEVSEEVYEQAAKEFLEGPLTAKVPTGRMDSISPARLKDVSPQPIEKKINPVANTFADLTKVLYQIAAKEDIRFYLKGVNVETAKKRLVVTDGHRMAAINNISLKDVPKAAGNETVYTKDNKYIDGQFPDVDRVLPTKHAKNKVTIDVAPLGDYARGANKAWRYISSKMAAPVPLIIGESTYTFNAKYIEDMSNLFRQLGYDTAEVSLADGKLYATSPDGKVQQVVMSMRDDAPLYSKYALERNMVISGEGLIREITPEDRKLLTNSTKELTDAETSKLEKVYGSKRDSDEFLQKLRDDATKYINDGANSIEKAIRSIIAKVAAAMLSVAIVFNPNFMSDASAVVIPQQTVEVRAEVPKDASGMSAAGKKAYATLYPALQAGLQKDNKYFTVVDKPTSQMFVFNPDGSMLLKSNVLLGSQFGDTYVGQTDFKENRMTPAGLFKPKAEKGSATYDGKTVYTFGNVKEGWNAVFMHSVYLKAGDADARLKGLDKGDRTRLSYGCVNGPEAVMNKLDNPSMDESHVFIVPDNQAAVDDYIANRVSNEDLTRETVTPVTKKVPSERAKTMSEQDVFGREEELPLKPKKTQAEINRERQQAKKAVAESDDKTIFYGNFTGEITQDQLDAMNGEVRDEKILELAKISRRLTTTTKKIARIGGDIETQKRLNYLLGKQADLRNAIDASKPERRSADWFRARAAEELAKGNLMPETMAVVDELYKKYPSFLEGLKLSVRAGKRAGVEGSFEPIDRLVSIFKNPFSITQDETMRHEIMHSLEQMMTPEAQKALVNAWGSGLAKAINKHKDLRSQEFFNAVLEYVDNPTRENYSKATNKMPNIGFYQYMNPSEFWAVNGEKLMKSQLGNSWARFVKGVQKILEALKSVFGFDNRYAVHREFDRLMKGESGQMTDTMLADYIKRGDIKIDFLNQVEDVDELLEKHERPNAPLHPSDSLKDKLLHKTEKITELAEQYKNNPRLEASKMIGGLDRGVTYARNKNVYFGTGLELADVRRYGGKLRDEEGFAVASIALVNAVHAGHVGTQVVTQGGLRFDPETQQFTAYKSKYSLANIVREKTKLIEQLGEQRATNVIQAFFEAKRSRSIQNEFYDRQAEYENLKAAFEAAVDTETKNTYYKQMMAAQEDLRSVSVALDKVNMTDEAIDDFIALEKKYPELKEMMRNWSAINLNMIDNLEFSGIISKKRAETLRNIKDYVPWYRIQDDMADPHDQPAKGVRGLTNISGVKRFKEGQTDKDIDDIVDNMIHNVMMTTRNSIRNYASNRIAQQYATRNDENKIKVFPKEGTTTEGAVRVNILANGRRIIVEIKDPLIAESVLGMESIEIPMINALGIMANGLRRGITSNPLFQVKQLFMDAPTAALVSGVKNPAAVWAGTFSSFIAALKPNDPIIQMLKSYGIGGYQSSSRTPEKELKVQLGLIGKSPLAYMLKILDQIGDASDYAQRRSVYKQVLKETGDEMQALLQANNVIDFLKHGSGRAAQASVRTVAFMNAYAQSMDVMAQAMAGGGLKGKQRSKVFTQFVKTGLLLSTLSLLYSFAIGDDEEYQQMDDQTKARNFIIPKNMTKFIGMDNSIKIPMHTSASFFFKSVPEMIYNKVMNEGTKNQVDNQRLRTALKEAAVDALLGPNITPTGVKPFLEIALNKNFFTGGTLTPRGMENLESFRQYTASTSEVGKLISKATLGALNPIEVDHLVKSLFGTAGAAVMWGSNMFSGDRPEPNASANPLYGAFVSAPVPRGPEDIYYDLKDRTTKVHDTFIDMMKKGRTEQAKQYRKDNEKLFKAYGYTNGVEQGLKQLNAEIRRVSDLPGDKLSPEEKRERITFYQNKKNDILQDVIAYRKQAGL